MGRLSRNEIEEGTQADKRRAAKSKAKSQSQSQQAQHKTGRHAAAKKSLPLRRGQGH